DFFPAEYALVFGTTLRIFIASIAGFLFSQLHDVWAFHYWKQKTQGKFLWLRNNASTIVSQLIDTVLFMFIAFYAVTPKHDVSYIIALIIPYYLLKVVVAILDTPFVYLGVNWLRGSAAPAQNQQGGGIKGQSPQSQAQAQTPLQRTTQKTPQKPRTGRWAVK
ncbi:queuosine precursor transporter, partial [Candidatus Micrarchaeota archaeon]|nr:queuosine precursor transporter [Candidatus Micrarchaeota archaeon]MBU1939236.1 queuosine precursor transporter [Candidatus Micrarchaeota archaeon]